MEAATPMLKQYREIKSRYRDAILFFRLGDFYEMFFEDAQVASSILELVLTGRGKDPANRIPMCGVPYHSADTYIAKLIKAGHKVAICEQVEDPATAVGIVKRDVIRVITAGTFLDDTSDSRYLLSLCPNGKTVGIAFTDTATGTIHTNQFNNVHQTIELIAKLPVYECIFPESAKQEIKNFLDHPLLKPKNLTLSGFEDWTFNREIAKKALCDHFATHNLAGFGIEDLFQAQSSCGALLEYLRQMNKQPLRHIDKISLYAESDYVFIAPAAHYGLEMEELLRTLDQTQTPMGRRMFRFWLYHPLKNIEAIRLRQQAVNFLKNSTVETQNFASLRSFPDLEKSLSRLSCGTATPKDLLIIRNALVRTPEIQETVKALAERNPLFRLDDVCDLRELLDRTVNPEMPLGNPEGKIIKAGYDQEIDELRSLQDNGQEWLRNYQAQEIKRTKINSLKVGYNRVFGYYIEITNTHKNLVPPDYIRKQTLTNGERYITPELKTYEEKFLTAQEKILKIEQRIVRELQEAILDHGSALHTFCDQIATLDVIHSLSRVADWPGYIVPKLSTGSELAIKDGRHPVVERTTEDSFIANDTLMDCTDNHLIILTGPNMAGKSTYIRQTAILVIMAQMGSSIPAADATIGLVDKIYTRIGAHDDIAKGQSTFMVEMTEAADILNNCTPTSLIILDEIGRGTSTSDGLSLAWAIAEHLQQKKIRTLFATHFHELVALADQHPGVKNYNVAVKEWEDKIIFLHKIVPGGTDDSYGIYVAKLAGIPESVIKRSKKILMEIEVETPLMASLRTDHNEQQLGLFTTPLSNPIAEEIKATLEALDVNNITPIQALNVLQELKNKTK